MLFGKKKDESPTEKTDEKEVDKKKVDETSNAPKGEQGKADFAEKGDSEQKPQGEKSTAETAKNGENESKEKAEDTAENGEEVSKEKAESGVKNPQTEISDDYIRSMIRETVGEIIEQKVSEILAKSQRSPATEDVSSRLDKLTARYSED